MQASPLAPALAFLAAAVPAAAEDAAAVPSDAPRPATCGSKTYPSTADGDAACIKAAGPLAARRGNLLILRMDDGSRKTFDTAVSSGGGDGYGYALLDFDPVAHIFTLGDLAADTGVLFTIDGRSGRRIDFGGGFPFYSPTTRLVLTEDDPVEGEERPTRFAILNMADGTRTTVWSRTAGKGMVPNDARFGRWLSDGAVRLDVPGKAPVFVTLGADGKCTVGTAAPDGRAPDRAVKPR